MSNSDDPPGCFSVIVGLIILGFLLFFLSMIIFLLADYIVNFYVALFYLYVETLTESLPSYQARIVVASFALIFCSAAVWVFLYPSIQRTLIEKRLKIAEDKALKAEEEARIAQISEIERQNNIAKSAQVVDSAISKILSNLRAITQYSKSLNPDSIENVTSICNSIDLIIDEMLNDTDIVHIIDNIRSLSPSRTRILHHDLYDTIENLERHEYTQKAARRLIAFFGNHERYRE